VSGKATGCGFIHDAAAKASVAITFTYNTCVSQWAAARRQWCYLRLSRQSHCGRHNSRLDHGAPRYRTTTKGQIPCSSFSSTSCGQDGSLKDVLLSLHNDFSTFTCLAERKNLALPRQLYATTLPTTCRIDLSVGGLNRRQVRPVTSPAVPSSSLIGHLDILKTARSPQDRPQTSSQSTARYTVCLPSLTRPKAALRCTSPDTILHSARLVPCQDTGSFGASIAAFAKIIPPLEHHHCHHLE
jgi:hypothetical protein